MKPSSGEVYIEGGSEEPNDPSDPSDTSDFDAPDAWGEKILSNQAARRERNQAAKKARKDAEDEPYKSYLEAQRILSKDSLLGAARDLGKKMFSKGDRHVLDSGKLDMDYWTEQELMIFIQYQDITSKVLESTMVETPFNPNNPATARYMQNPSDVVNMERIEEAAENDRVFYEKISGVLQDIDSKSPRFNGVVGSLYDTVYGSANDEEKPRFITRCKLVHKMAELAPPHALRRGINKDVNRFILGRAKMLAENLTNIQQNRANFVRAFMIHRNADRGATVGGPILTDQEIIRGFERDRATPIPNVPMNAPITTREQGFVKFKQSFINDLKKAISQQRVVEFLPYLRKHNEAAGEGPLVPPASLQSENFYGSGGEENPLLDQGGQSEMSADVKSEEEKPGFWRSIKNRLSIRGGGKRRTKRRSRKKTKKRRTKKRKSKKRTYRRRR